jgi:hypothetical protein
MDADGLQPPMIPTRSWPSDTIQKNLKYEKRIVFMKRQLEMANTVGFITNEIE